MKLSVKVGESAGAAILYLRGRICFREEAALFSRTAVECLHSGKHLILELSNVESLDSAGLGELVLLHMQACAAGCEVRMVAPSKRVQELLELTNVASLFSVCPTLDAALTSVAGEVA
ncbi:MAG: STAS domain-containing protein [Acidobacteria bacterium]|nr:STAS domain-containing protein [Acidobacteriota bacterium]